MLLEQSRLRFAGLWFCLTSNSTKPNITCILITTDSSDGSAEKFGKYQLKPAEAVLDPFTCEACYLSRDVQISRSSIGIAQ
jgi:hypothetical protein